jgi:hypothetical protein
VERYNRTYQEECLRLDAPTDLESARVATAAFATHYNEERPNQALSRGNRPPKVACAQWPPRPAVPRVVDPDAWLVPLDGRRYVRKVRSNGTITVDEVAYYIGAPLTGQTVALRVDATQRTFVVEHRDHPLKELSIAGLHGAPLAWEDYLAHMRAEARTATTGSPLVQQLRLPL